ncbi:hypothetical protein X777_09183 [Ooceraea biroi]|uniref:Uncharacterized protein n=1 Tax=Ooceraea biroi TaxID=2015173 RepID=A0A026W747_OOCBI|nr:hypothetical protein X777_09183 [Ooceraea biroi]
MAAPCGVPPRNLSRFKLTHAEPAGGPQGHAAGSLRRGMVEIISPYIQILFVFLLENDRPALFFFSLTIAL